MLRRCQMRLFHLPVLSCTLLSTGNCILAELLAVGTPHMHLIAGAQIIIPQRMVLWHVEYFEPKQTRMSGKQPQNPEL